MQNLCYYLLMTKPVTGITLQDNIFLYYRNSQYHQLINICNKCKLNNPPFLDMYNVTGIPFCINLAFLHTFFFSVQMSELFSLPIFYEINVLHFPNILWSCKRGHYCSNTTNIAAFENKRAARYHLRHCDGYLFFDLGAKHNV